MPFLWNKKIHAKKYYNHFSYTLFFLFLETYILLSYHQTKLQTHCQILYYLNHNE